MTVHHRHVWLKPFLKFLKDAEDDAATQIKIHRISIRFWIVNFVVASFVFFALPDIWNAYSLYYLTSLSLYANFATDYGALIASQAAYGIGKQAESIAKDISHD